MIEDGFVSNKRPFSPGRRNHSITPFRQAEAPSPQRPYKNSPNYIVPSSAAIYNGSGRPMTAVSNTPVKNFIQQQDPIKPLKNTNKKPPSQNRSRNISPTPSTVLNVRSSRMFQIMNEKNHRLESVMENFLNIAAGQPLFSATENVLIEELGANSAVFWQDIPSLQLLYSQKLNKSIGHTKGILGQAFFMRQKMNVQDIKANIFYDENIDGLAGDEALPHIFFPLWDFSNTVCAVVQVAKEGGFNEQDEEFIAYFIKKFKVYSHWLDKVDLPHQLLLELLQNMEMEQFLLLFQRKLTALFKCAAAEIWKLDKKTGKIFQYQKIENEMKDGNAGVVGEAFKKKVLINCESCKMRSSYHLPADGDVDQTVLVFPVTDSYETKMFAVALRGKVDAPVFTLQDEMLLRDITPYVILSFNNIEKFTNKNADDKLNQIEHRCVADLQELVEMLDSNVPPKDVVCSAMERLEQLSSADRCSLFLHNKKNNSLTTLYNGGLKAPISIPVDKGIVGLTYRESQVVNVPDVYEDPSFDSMTDLESGYRTRSLLSVPILTDNFKSIGVVQVMNRLDKKPFSNVDIGYAKIFARFCGLILCSSDRLAKLKVKSSQLTAYMKASEKISDGNETIKNTLKDLLSLAKESIDCEHFSLFIVDHVLGSLTSYIVDGPKIAPTLPLSNGIAAATVTNDKHPILIVNDAYHDPRFNSTMDMSNGFKTRSILAVPVFAKDKSVIGVIEMINKSNGGFGQEHANFMKVFGSMVGRVIEMQKMANVIKHGTAELEMQKWIGEIERKSFITPKKLQIDQADIPKVSGLNFFCIEWNGIGLFKVAFFVFNQFNLLERYQITNDLFFVFLVKLRSTYNDVTYHNWIHAIDVLQYVGYQIRKSNFQNILTSYELLALCVGAICHDANHEGLNNVYHEKAETPLGILYKGLSVCEMHHCAVAISILTKDDCNIFHAIPPNDQKIVWKFIISLIKATDMAFHFKLLKTANDIMDQGPINLSNASHRMMAMTMIIKIADISNVSRPFEIADKWCDVLCEEFWKQGDLELANGWELTSPLNDRSQTEKAKGQVGFYTHVCLPLYTALARFLPELQCNVDAINSNLNVWKEKVAQLEQLKQAKAEHQQGDAT